MSCFSPQCAAVPLKGGSPVFLGKGVHYPVGVRGDFRIVYIPCGHCSACLREKRQDLTLLQQLEASEHDDNWFITLTYDDEKSWVEDEYIPDNLNKDHIRQFLVSVRNHLRYASHITFRYFGCGEYGSKRERPHFHLNVFGCPSKALGLIDDTTVGAVDILNKNLSFDLRRHFLLDENGNSYWHSPLIEKFWRFGNHRIYRATRETFQYVAGYVLKKMTKKEARHEWIERQPEFNFQSRPSIGFNWWLKHFNEFQLYDPVSKKGVKTDLYFDGRCWRCPRIFDKWFIRQFQFDADPTLRFLKDVFSKDYPSIPDFEHLKRKELACRYKENQTQTKETIK